MSDITKTLDTLAAAGELSTLERILLSTDGTVQSLLSVIFGTPVRVEVLSQLGCGDVLVRWVQLVIDDPDPATVALAESVIPLKSNHTGFIGAMGDRDIGIGQAIENLRILTRRTILGIHVDANTFARTYRIEGDKIDVLITEIFDRGLYRRLK